MEDHYFDSAQQLAGGIGPHAGPGGPLGAVDVARDFDSALTAIVAGRLSRFLDADGLFLDSRGLQGADRAALSVVTSRMLAHFHQRGPAEPFEVTPHEYDLLRRAGRPVVLERAAGSLVNSGVVPGFGGLRIRVVDPEEEERNHRRARLRQRHVERLLG